MIHFALSAPDSDWWLQGYRGQMHILFFEYFSGNHAGFPTLDTLEVWFCEGQPWKDWKGRRRTPAASPGCLLDNMFTGLREPCAHRVRALELKSLEMNAYTTEAVFRLLDDRAAMGAPMESLVFSRCYCEDALDTRAVKKRFESYAGLALSIR